SLAYVVLLPLLAVGGGRGSLELRRRTAELVRLQDAELRAAIGEERRRIALDLHDVVAHEVAAVVVRARTGLRQARTQAELRDALGSIARLGSGALSATREVVEALHDPVQPAELSAISGVVAVRDLVETARQAGLHVEADVPADCPRLPHHVAVAAYRIVQESLTNVLRHSGATRAMVRLRVRGGRVLVSVADDGTHGPPPFDSPPSGYRDGRGLVGMRERAAAAGGRLRLATSPLGGWEVHAELPMRGPR
ncbi:MAG: sensor histidine kinase, partial [Phycicoccus sp.]